jgi:hypothetical protein
MTTYQVPGLAGEMEFELLCLLVLSVLGFSGQRNVYFIS